MRKAFYQRLTAVVLGCALYVQAVGPMYIQASSQQPALITIPSIRIVSIDQFSDIKDILLTKIPKGLALYEQKITKDIENLSSKNYKPDFERAYRTALNVLKANSQKIRKICYESSEYNIYDIDNRDPKNTIQDIIEAIQTMQQNSGDDSRKLDQINEIEMKIKSIETKIEPIVLEIKFFATNEKLDENSQHLSLANYTDKEKQSILQFKTKLQKNNSWTFWNTKNFYTEYKDRDVLLNIIDQYCIQFEKIKSIFSETKAKIKNKIVEKQALEHIKLDEQQNQKLTEASITMKKELETLKQQKQQLEDSADQDEQTENQIDQVDEQIQTLTHRIAALDIQIKQ